MKRFGLAIVAISAAGAASAQSCALSFDDQLWSDSVALNSCAGFFDYLDQCPGGFYRERAGRYLVDLDCRSDDGSEEAQADSALHLAMQNCGSTIHTFGADVWESTNTYTGDEQEFGVDIRWIGLSDVGEPATILYTYRMNFNDMDISAFRETNVISLRCVGDAACASGVEINFDSDGEEIGRSERDVSGFAFSCGAQDDLAAALRAHQDASRE